MPSKSFLLAAAAVAASLSLAAADIDCYYCGLQGLCELPYDVDDENTHVQKIACPEACVKFDGTSDEDGKRVLYRGCDMPDLALETNNICKENYEWFGATGSMCTCNAANCNKATGQARPSVAFAAASVLAALTAAKMMMAFNN